MPDRLDRQGAIGDVSPTAESRRPGIGQRCRGTARPTTRAVGRLHPQTLAVIDSIATGPRPQGVVASADGRTLFITPGGNHEAIRVDVATHEITGRVEVGPIPNEPTLSHDGACCLFLSGAAHTPPSWTWRQ